jgi:hypothetical protein
MLCLHKIPTFLIFLLKIFGKTLSRLVSVPICPSNKSDNLKIGIDIFFIARETANIGSADAIKDQFNSLKHALALTQGLISHRFRATPRLWLVTTNVHGSDINECSLVSSTIWGFGACVCLEHPELACKRIDLDSHEVFYTTPIL